MSRIAIALTAGVACIATVAVIATSGSAQGPVLTTLHLVEKEQKSVGFGPDRRPRQGDRFGFGSTVTGDDTGIGRAVCTVIGTNQALCNVQERLAKGTLSAQGLVSLSGRANKAPFTITGGTGAYDGARGSALVTDVNATTTDIQITLRP
jgi:hypothetical protein